MPGTGPELFRCRAGRTQRIQRVDAAPVEKAVGIVEELATPAEARQMLGLRKAA